MGGVEAGASLTLHEDNPGERERGEMGEAPTTSLIVMTSRFSTNQNLEGSRRLGQPKESKTDKAKKRVRRGLVAVCRLTASGGDDEVDDGTTMKISL